MQELTIFSLSLNFHVQNSEGYQNDAFIIKFMKLSRPAIFK